MTLFRTSGTVNCLKYVDDLTIAEKCTHPKSSQLQMILDSFSKWTENNSLSLNPAKCQALQVCFKTNGPPSTDLLVVHLTLLITQKYCVFGFNMISKTNHRLYMLTCRLLKRFGFKKDELITVYKG